MANRRLASSSINSSQQVLTAGEGSIDHCILGALGGTLFGASSGFALAKGFLAGLSTTPAGWTGAGVILGTTVLFAAGGGVVGTLAACK